MESFEESDFCGEFLRALIVSGFSRAGHFLYHGYPYCWGAFKEYGEPPEGSLVVEIDNQGAIEEYRIWYGDSSKGKVQRARHVRFNEFQYLRQSAVH